MAAILLYHAIANPVVDQSLQVRPETIDLHLSWCHSLGFELAPLSEILAYSAENLVAITFDDGLASIRESVQRLLLRGVEPTLFVCPATLGGHNTWASSGRVREELLELEDLQHLRSLGAHIGAHGWDHRVFTDRPREEMEQDLRRSHEWFASNLGTAPNVFAWPFGRYDPRSIDFVDRYYKHALGVEPPWGQEVSPMTIPRLSARDDMDFEGFASALELSNFVLDPDARRSP